MNDHDLGQLLRQEQIAPGFPKHKATLRAALVAAHAEAIRRPSQSSAPTGNSMWSRITQGEYMKRFYQKHAFATLALAMAFISATAGAASYYWFKAESQTTQKGDVAQIQIRGCSSNLLWQENMKDVFDFSENFRILRPDKVSREDIARSEIARCESEAIGTYVAKQAPQLISDKTAQKADSQGYFFTNQVSGKLIAVEDKSLTIETNQYPASVPTAGSAEDYREALTKPVLVRQFTVAFDSQVVIGDKGKPVSRSALTPGQFVSIFYRNLGKPNQKIEFSSIEALNRISDINETSRVCAVIVRQTDPADEMIYPDAVNNRWIEVLTTNNTSRG